MIHAYGQEYVVYCSCQHLRRVVSHSRATHVQNEDGSLVLLSARHARQREAVARRLLTPSKNPALQGTCKKVREQLLIDVLSWLSKVSLFFFVKVLFDLSHPF